MFFSIVVPLYNRPQEIRELLQSLTTQSYARFEVMIVEDGSDVPAEEVVMSFEGTLDVQYFFKANEGQGFARNYGFERAAGDYFIVLDSDVILPKDYLLRVYEGIQQRQWDAFGGPDAAHSSFSVVQKAINYSMTSPFTTGGIRGNKKHVGTFHPRSFNMGISRKVYEATKGFRLARRSEDMEFSIRMINQGFRVGLIPEAYVYHKRRTSVAQFFKQTYSFGKGRVDIHKLYPGELKWVHLLPSAFTVGVFGVIVLGGLQLLPIATSPWMDFLFTVGAGFLVLYVLCLCLHALFKTRDVRVALMSVVTAFTQLLAYGLGFIVQFAQERMSKNRFGT